MSDRRQSIWRDPLAECFGKASFVTAALAQRVLTRMRRGKRNRASSTAYRCRFCGHWHIGTPNKKRKR